MFHHLGEVLLGFESRFAFLIDDTHDGMRSLLRSLELQESMRMRNRSLTLLTEVEVLADRRLVADTDNRGHATSVTDVTMVDNLGLSFLGHHVGVLADRRLVA